MIAYLDIGIGFGLAREELSIPVGQLLTPLTRYSDAGLEFAIDNGAYSNFNQSGYMSLIDRQQSVIKRCKFVVVPDVVGNARRTTEIFHRWKRYLNGLPLAYVAQDGIDEIDIPWEEFNCLFIGGTTSFKLGDSALAAIRAAKTLGKWVHVGRVNTPKRYLYFKREGVDSIDGSGISRYSHMRLAIGKADKEFSND